MRRHYHTIIVGAGPAGCAAAATLAERSDESILLLEAGADYGSLDSGAWPADLLDASVLAESHDWNYTSGDMYANRVLNWSRARVIGGCSSHNGCAAIWGHRADYDAWEALGNSGWSTNDLLPVFEDVSRRMRVRIPDEAEVQPFQRAFLDSAVATGIPRVADLNDLDEPVGVAPSPVNIAGGIRWNGALAFLDPLREAENLTILGDALVDRVQLNGNAASGVHLIVDGHRELIEADRVVLAGGAYGSPAILLRSGIGPADELRHFGIAVNVDLPGVGGNLHDHPALDIPVAGTKALRAEMDSFSASNWIPEEQVIAKVRSRHCREAFDLHIYPVGGRTGEGWQFKLDIACMTPRSRGKLTLRSTDPDDAPLLDHGYLSDPDGHDAAVLLDGLKIAREIIASDSRMGAELDPCPAIMSDAELLRWIHDNVGHYYHPVGTCKMGPETDADAVVDPCGRVYGVSGLLVADCAIMPVIPRANTNIPAAVVGARIAAWL